MAVRAPGARDVRDLRAPAALPDGPVLLLSLGWGRSGDVGRSRRTTRRVLSDPDLRETILNAFRLVVFFSFIPVTLGLRRRERDPPGRDRAARRGRTDRPVPAAGHAAGRSRHHLGLAAGAARASSTRLLSAIGLGDVTRAWLGDFDTALPAVGIIGIWVLLGFCIVLLLTGMTKVDAGLYESARIDGASWFQELQGDHDPEPPVRDRRLPDRHDHRRARGLRHRLRLDGGGPGNGDHGARHPDLLHGLSRAPGRPRVGARGRADGPRPGDHPPASSA